MISDDSHSIRSSSYLSHDDSNAGHDTINNVRRPGNDTTFSSCHRMCRPINLSTQHSFSCFNRGKRKACVCNENTHANDGDSYVDGDQTVVDDDTIVVYDDTVAKADDVMMNAVGTQGTPIDENMSESIFPGPSRLSYQKRPILGESTAPTKKMKYPTVSQISSVETTMIDEEHPFSEIEHRTRQNRYF